MEKYTYYGTNAPPKCGHEFIELRKGVMLKRGVVHRVKAFECAKCLVVRTEIETRYPPL